MFPMYFPIVCQRPPERMNVPDERSWSASAGRPIGDAPGDSQQASSARHAAEALFKPKAPAAPIQRASPTTDAAGGAQTSQRQPPHLTKVQAEAEPRPRPRTTDA